MVATLNRNSSVLLVLAYFLVFADCWRERRYWLIGALIIGVWAGVYGGLVLLRGETVPWITVADNLHDNVGGWLYSKTIPYHLALMPLMGLALFARRTPSHLRRLLWLVPVYGVFLLPFAAWWEIRLWLSLFPVVIPAALIALERG